MSVRQKRIAEDYRILRDLHKKKVIRQVKAFPIGSNTKKTAEHLAVSFEGPKNTPYHKGIFKLEIKYGSNYPYKPPYLKMHTAIYHPNIWPNPNEYPGKRNICLALIDQELIGKPGGWSASKNIGTIIHSIIVMLNIQGAFFNPSDVFNKKAAAHFMKNQKNFSKKAKEITKKYAKKGWD